MRGRKGKKEEDGKDIARGKAENKIRNGRKDDHLLTKDKPQEQRQKKCLFLIACIYNKKKNQLLRPVSMESILMLDACKNLWIT